MGDAFGQDRSSLGPSSCHYDLDTYRGGRGLIDVVGHAGIDGADRGPQPAVRRVRIDEPVGAVQRRGESYLAGLSAAAVPEAVSLKSERGNDEAVAVSWDSRS